MKYDITIIYMPPICDILAKTFVSTCVCVSQAPKKALS